MASKHSFFFLAIVYLIWQQTQLGCTDHLKWNAEIPISCQFVVQTYELLLSTGEMMVSKHHCVQNASVCRSNNGDYFFKLSF